MGELFEKDLFDLVAGNREGFATKPDPSLALDVMRRLGVKPEDCVFVGDSGVDMQTEMCIRDSPPYCLTKGKRNLQKKSSLREIRSDRRRGRGSKQR